MSWYREEYLKSDDWRNLRLAILIFQEYICECCGGAATDVHHITYRNIWDVDSYDLMACCRTCHGLIHDFMDKNPDILNTRKNTKRRHGAIAARARIAEHVPPIGYVRFKLSTSKGDIKRIRIWPQGVAKDKSLQRKQKKDLTGVT